MVVASVIAHRWMEGLPRFEGTREIAYRGQLNIEFFLAKGAVVGAIIGLLVPNWFRTSRIETPAQLLSRKLVAESENDIKEADGMAAKDIEEIFATASAYVASADGHVEQREREVVRQTFYELSIRKLAEELVVDRAMDRFDELCTAFRRHSNASKEKSLFPLRALRGRPKTSDILVYFSLTVAHADGVFDREESTAIASIVTELDLVHETYPLKPTSAGIQEPLELTCATFVRANPRRGSDGCRRADALFDPARDRQQLIIVAETGHQLDSDRQSPSR